MRNIGFYRFFCIIGKLFEYFYGIYLKVLFWYKERWNYKDVNILDCFVFLVCYESNWFEIFIRGWMLFSRKRGYFVDNFKVLVYFICCVGVLR